MIPFKPIFTHVNITGIDKIDVRFDVSNIIALLFLPEFIMRVFESHKLWIYLMAFIVVLYDSLAFSQTCILFRKDDTEIFVGADSYTIQKTRKSRSATVIDSTFTSCKIVSCGKFFVSSAGITYSKSFDWDFDETMKDICSFSINPVEIINNIDGIIKIKLIPILYEARRRSIPYFNRAYVNGGGALIFILYGFIDDKPFIYKRTYKARVDRSNSISTYLYELDSFDSTIGEITGSFGVDYEIEKILKENPYFLNSNTYDGIRYLMNRQASVDTTGHVGMPINIVRITKDGAEWKEKNKVCPQ